MVTFNMGDIPGDVWDSVYKKWDNALIHGWSSSLWFRCSLCRWLWQSRLYCDDCPLVADGWCDSSINSRLHRCHYGSDEDWEYEVKRFMEFIKPYCLEKKEV